MAEQPELDLPPVPTPAPRNTSAVHKAGFGGFSRQQILIGMLVLALIIWAMWVTRALTAPREEHIVSARLSALVGDYVEAQRFSGSPPERVEAEMRAFMTSLDKELERRSASGQVVLVGEAVLTKNVPDITDSLKTAVFAAGVPIPKRASVEELQRLQALSSAQAAIAARQPQPSRPQGPVDPLGAASALPLQPEGQIVVPSQQMTPIGPGASVATFGGPDGNGRQ
jgi:hypothetical protein